MTHGLVTKRTWVGSDRTTGKWRTYKIRRGKALTTWRQTPKGHAHLRKVMRRPYLSSELEAAQDKGQISKNDSKTQTLWLISLWCSSYCLSQCRESCKHLKIPQQLIFHDPFSPWNYQEGGRTFLPSGLSQAQTSSWSVGRYLPKLIACVKAQSSLAGREETICTWPQSGLGLCLHSSVNWGLVPGRQASSPLSLAPNTGQNDNWAWPSVIPEMLNPAQIHKKCHNPIPHPQ